MTLDIFSPLDISAHATRTSYLSRVYAGVMMGG